MTPTRRTDSADLSGFAAETPLEICHAYARGEISRERLIDELRRYPYVPHKPIGYGDDPVIYPGERAEIATAFHLGLIDIETYAEIVD